MPVYRFQCSCGQYVDQLVDIGTISVKCGCGKNMKKGFAPCSFKMSADLNWRQQAWIESEETQKRLKSGELRPMTKAENDSD